MSRHPIPPEALQQHIAVLGKTGSGKTSTAKLAVEQVVADSFRVCILDPIKSDWWGLTSSADGKRAGLPFHILGGPHGHVPLHASAGKAIAEVVASGALPVSIIDMADFEPGGQAHFFVDFAATLLKRMRGVVYLVIEEAHLFAPKERSGIGKENMSIHWAKMLATAGRSKGIRLILATQRTQALHNALLGSCDTMITHRLTAPADQAPVINWLKANTDAKTTKAVAESLSSLKDGEGWLCSGEARLFEKVQFPRIASYDNTKTPTNDTSARMVTTAPVDREKLRAIIGDAVKSAEDEDPKILRKRVAELEAALNAQTDGVGTAAIDAARQKGYSEGYALGSHHIIGAVTATWAARNQRAQDALLVADNEFDAFGNFLLERTNANPLPIPPISDAAAANLKAFRNTVISGPRDPEPARTGTAGTDMPKAERAFLTALAQSHPKAASRARLSMLAGYSPTSSTTANALTALRTNGYLDGRGDDMTITPAGFNALGAYDALPIGPELRAFWLNRLDGAEQAFLSVAFSYYPRAVTKENLSREADYSATSSTFANALTKLRTLGFITGRGEFKASDEFFQ